MFEYDRSNYMGLLKDFPEQIPTALKCVTDAGLSVSGEGVRNIVLAGMGGSAISGDLLLGYLRDELAVPGMVNRSYTVPAFVSEDTLFVATSYSGNTEETLSATRAALERKARVVGISSGGELAALCAEHKCPHVTVPGGLPPRQALGYLFFPLLKVMEAGGFIASRDAEIEETYRLLRELDHRFDPDYSQGNNLANHIAQSIYHAIPVTYVGVDYLHGVPVRWRNQFSENAKSMAFSNIFPELNHNEIMGWEGLEDVNKHFRVIFLRDAGESDRMKQRIDITKKLLRKRNILLGEIYAEGESRLARMFSLIYIGDWASFYWAMLNEKDPTAIDSIDHLKEQLSAQPA